MKRDTKENQNLLRSVFDVIQGEGGGPSAKNSAFPPLSFEGRHFPMMTGAQNSDAQDYLAAVSVPIILIDGNGLVSDLNPAATKIFGNRINGRPYTSVLRGPEVIAKIENALSQRTPAQAGFEKVIEGKNQLFHLDITPVSSANIVVTFVDVSAEFAAGQARSDFVANVSHELKTPLTAISGIIETLQTVAADDPPAQARFLDMMAKEAARMDRLVRDLLVLSKVENPHMSQFMDIDVCTILQAATETLETLARSKTVRFILDRSHNQLVIRGHKDQITQVFLNLLENAVNHGDPQSDVQIDLSGPKHQPILGCQGIQIDVTDQGAGIADEHIGRLTERFYRVDTHRSRNDGGTGLGLAIVKHIVTNHGGRLRISSTLGQGSTFSVFLPTSKK